MGILADAVGIVCGGLLGGRLKKGMSRENNCILGIGIMIVSLVGFFENIYRISGESIASENLMIVLFAYLIGSRLGDAMHLEERLDQIGRGEEGSRNAFLDAVLFFGIGGLQICGPVALALHHDNSQLLLKSVIDIPFAIALGSAYGKMVALSAIPVAAIQILIAGAAFACAAIFSNEMVAQLCAMGYIILFFSGFNLVTEGKYKIHNLNMLPGIFLLILYHGVLGIWK